MINTETELILKWSQNCVLTGKATREAIAECDDPDAEPAVNAINRPTNLKFNVTDCKLYVPAVTLQEKYENELYQNLKTGIDIDFEWKRYRTQIINQPATNNLNFLIDPTFNNVSRLFVLAFPNEEDRSSFSKYYIPTIEIKDYNVLIDLQPFYDLPIKNKEQTYKAITELINHDNHITGNSLTYEYFCNHYKLIAIDLSRQNSEFKNQQINFVGKLEQNATIFFIIEEKVTTGIKFQQNTLTIICNMESQKIKNLLDHKDEIYSRFQTKECYIINDRNNGNYPEGNGNDKGIKIDTEVVKPFLCDYADAYILVTGDIAVTRGNVSTKVAFKNCHPFIKCKIHSCAC